MSRCTPASDGIVRLGDIAKVTMGTVPQWMLVDDNGKPAVTFDVYQQDSADSLSPGEGGAAAARCLHEDASRARSSSTSGTTRRSSSAPRFRALEEAILIGLVFAALVLFAFLRNWRMTLVAMMVVPLSVLITVLLLYAARHDASTS